MFLKKKGFVPDKNLFKHVSRNAYELTCGMMHWDISKRITLADLNVVLQNSVSYLKKQKALIGRGANILVMWMRTI